MADADPIVAVGHGVVGAVAATATGTRAPVEVGEVDQDLATAWNVKN